MVRKIFQFNVERSKRKGKIVERVRRRTKVGMKNMLKLFCVNTGMMQQLQNYTVLKIRRNRKSNHFRAEIATGQSSGTELSYSLAWGGSAWLTWHDENFRHFTYLT